MRAIEDGVRNIYDRIDAIEREVKHDVIAFLTHLAEFVGPDAPDGDVLGHRGTRSAKAHRADQHGEREDQHGEGDEDRDDALAGAGEAGRNEVEGEVGFLADAVGSAEQADPGIAADIGETGGSIFAKGLR